MNLPALAPTAAIDHVSLEVTRTRAQHRALVEEHGALVRTVARRIFCRLPQSARGFEEEDLVSVGVIGLLDAWSRYEPRDGVSFASFAEFRIKGAILDEIRRQDFMPRRLRAKANALRKVVRSLETSLGRTATTEELAAAMGLGAEALEALRSKVAPYHFVADDDECVTLRSPLADPARVVLEKELRTKLVEALEGLGEREKLLLDLYFNKELKLREIAELLDVTEGRVSQIKSAAIAVLRKRLATSGLRAN